MRHNWDWLGIDLSCRNTDCSACSGNKDSGLVLTVSLQMEYSLSLEACVTVVDKYIFAALSIVGNAFLFQQTAMRAVDSLSMVREGNKGSTCYVVSVQFQETPVADNSSNTPCIG